MVEIKAYAGSNIDNAWKNLLKESAEREDTCFCIFNGKEIYSTDTLDDAYVKVTGKTKAEYEKEMKEWHDEYKRQKEEHESRIPSLTELYRKKARGVILESQYDYWDKIVPIRLGDLYQGMELDCTLELCDIMRDESVDYDKRLRKAYDTFMGQGHSGMSAGLVASMLRTFCPNGSDLADAVMNFRFEKDETNRD